MLETLLATLPDALTAAHITFACCLWFMDKHKVGGDWRKTSPKLGAWYDKFKTRPSLVATEA